MRVYSVAVVMDYADRGLLGLGFIAYRGSKKNVAGLAAA